MFLKMKASHLHLLWCGESTWEGAIFFFLKSCFPLAYNHVCPHPSRTPDCRSPSSSLRIPRCYSLFFFCWNSTSLMCLFLQACLILSEFATSIQNIFTRFQCCSACILSQFVASTSCGKLVHRTLDPVWSLIGNLYQLLLFAACLFIQKLPIDMFLWKNKFGIIVLFWSRRDPVFPEVLLRKWSVIMRWVSNFSKLYKSLPNLYSSQMVSSVSEERSFSASRGLWNFISC